jgi:hypothetical protein
MSGMSDNLQDLVADAIAKEAARIEVAKRLDAITLERNRIEVEHREAMHESRVAEGRIKGYIWKQAHSDQAQ